MFILAAGSHPKVTHGQLEMVTIIYDSVGEIVSGVVQFQEGFVVDDKFQSLGSNQMRLGVEMKAWVETNIMPEDKTKAELWLANEKALAPVRPVVVDVVKPVNPLLPK